MVQQQIMSTNLQIQGMGQDLVSLGNEVRNLVNQLQALQPPVSPGADASDAAKAAFAAAQAQYAAAVKNIQEQIANLNAKSQQIANKISELQNKVHRLEGTELPDAQRRDAERQDRELKQAREQYESIAKSVEGGTKQTEADRAAKTDVARKQMRIGAPTSADTTASHDQRTTLRVQWRTTEVKFDQSSDLKTLVRAFSMHLAVMGDGAGVKKNPAVGMPDTPGVGLPYHVEPVTSS